MRLAAALLAVAAAAAVDVQRLPAFFEQDIQLTIDNTVEYILEFNPTAEQAGWPSRVWLAASADDPAQPVLVTARQPTGAVTWQLPYRSQDGALLQQLQRTLCFNFTGAVVGAGAAFSLHMSSAGGGAVRVTARADPARDSLLQMDSPATVTVTQTGAGVYYYGWGAESRARLLLESPDDVCATLAVHNYTCPMAETAQTVSVGGLRMTVQRSGGIHLARSQFPEGFYVMVVVQDSDRECTGAEERDADWLWEAALGAEDAITTPAPAPAPAPPQRTKTVTLTVRAALTRAQYAAASAVTLLVFLAFYAGFLALVFAQRYRPFKRLIQPKAVLADTKTGEDEVDTGVRRRRGSDATFDSVDDDSESDEDPEPSQPVRRPVGQPVGQPVSQADSQRVSTAAVNGAYMGDVTADVTPGDVTGGVAVISTAAPYDTVVAPASADVGPSPTTGAAQDQPVAAAPFGLPARLRVAALARHRGRTLRARSDRYLHTLYTVAVFYALPVLQFVAAFQLVLNVWGSLDLCYYNFLCAHPLGQLSDFNHVLSNLGYLLLGALFMLQVRRRRARRRRKPRHEEYGIPAHYGLLSALGAGMMMVALLSASYHVCPNRLNFQFDTAFMYVLAVLSMVKIYQARHPDINARAHSTFGVLAVLIALVVWGVLGGGALFWGVWTVLHVFTFLLLSLRIYYVGQFRLDGSGLAEAARGLRSLPAARPLYVPRLVMLVIANALNWAFALYGLFTMPADFAGHLLSVLLCNTLVYMTFYLCMKLLHGERPRWYAWCFLAAAAAAWAPALYFFVSGSSDWAATPAASRHRNHECRVLHFYDSHDLWHFLSAVALYLSFNTMLTWDDGLAAVKRTEIAVF